jgi:hypothetical protein
MVHALQQAARVLQPAGLLIDLRPAPVHRRAGIVHQSDILPVGSMHEDLASDRAADTALGRFIRGGSVRRRSTTIDCHRYLTGWLTFASTLPSSDVPAHARLLRRVEDL